MKRTVTRTHTHWDPAAPDATGQGFQRVAFGESVTDFWFKTILQKKNHTQAEVVREVEVNVCLLRLFEDSICVPKIEKRTNASVESFLTSPRFFLNLTLRGTPFTTAPMLPRRWFSSLVGALGWVLFFAVWRSPQPDCERQVVNHPTVRPAITPPSAFPSSYLGAQLGPHTLHVTTPGAADVGSWCTVLGLEGLGAMTQDEVDLHVKYVTAAARAGRSYLEWGSGSSTLRSIRGGVAHATVVDSSVGALHCALSHPDVAKAAQEGRVTALFVDIDADPFNWGKPQSKKRVSAWPEYSDVVRRLPDPSTVGLVLVDGRFRVACTMKAVAMLRDDTFILVHDFERRSYSLPIKLGVVRLVEQVGRLAVLQRVPSTAAGIEAKGLAGWVAVWRGEELKSERR